jgi:penicillin-binding protein 1C
MQLALDPRIPDDQEAFVFKLANLPDGAAVDWYVDDKMLAAASTGAYLWPLQRGAHSVRALIRSQDSGQIQVTPDVNFTVK